MADESPDEFLRADGGELPADEHEPVDAWAGALPGKVMVPAYLAARFAAQYRVIVDVLLDAQDDSLTGMSFDEVDRAVRHRVVGLVGERSAERLLGDAAFNLEARLGRLVQWGVLTRWQEPARTGDDFLRRRDRYQLTPLAARLHAFWRDADDAEEESGDLTLAPRAIHDRLAAFTDAVRQKRYPAAAGEFQQVIAVHHGMARAARAWQRALAHNLSGVPDEAKQELVWRTLQSYVAMWGEQVDVHSPRIASLIEQLAPRLTEGVWRACVRGALAEDASDDMVRSQTARWQNVWRALEVWFRGPQAQAKRLRRQLRDIIGPWARNTQILMDAGGTVTRSAELIELATAIENAPDDEAAWRVWDTALGAFPPRHLLLLSDAADDGTQSWAAAPPAPVTARYREHGNRTLVGRRPRRADYSAGREAARRARLSDLAERSEAESTLRQRSGTFLSEWPELSRAEFDLLLDLLGTAHRAGTGGEAITDDGRWRVCIREPQDPGAIATLRGRDGRLVTVDWHFELEPAE